MNAPMPLRRGWCPGIMRPMPTGDGLLVRVHPPAGRLSSEHARAIAGAAQSCGNGVVEISSRANVQIRGVSESTHARLVALLDEAGLNDSGGPGPYRPCMVSPLAGLDPGEVLDARALAQELDLRLGSDPSLAMLPAKFGVVFDSGGVFPLDSARADIRIVADPDALIRIGMASSGGTAWLGPFRAEEAPAAVHQIARALAEALRTTGATRIGHVAPAVLAALDLPHATAPLPRPTSAPRIGAIDLGGRWAAAIGLPFGRCGAHALLSVAKLAENFGTSEIRTAPWRALVVPVRTKAAAAAVLAGAAGLGLAVDPGDPRLAISACAGQPGCASAQVPSHEDAAQLAALISETGADFSVHVSGCRKGCALRLPADLTLVGSRGAYDVVLAGTPADEAVARLPLAEILFRLRRTQSLGEAFPEALR